MPSSPLPRGQGPAVTGCSFQQGEAIRFTRGALLTKRPVGVAGTPLDVTADGSIYAVFHQTEVLIVHAEGSKGWSVTAHPSVQARFSPRGDRVAVFDFGLRVFDVVTQQQLFHHEQISPCTVRWQTNDELAYQGEPSQGNEWREHLVRANVATGERLALGPKRWVMGCAASADGAWWVLQVHVARGQDAALLVDGRTGAARQLVDRQTTPELVVSPAADRYCWQGGEGRSAAELRCAHASDGTEELVAAGLSYPTLHFGPSGRRALLTYAVENWQGIHNPVELVDFTTCTRRDLVGFETQSGSVPAMTSGGRLLTIVSAMGMYAYDL
ncbi:MAG: hypothetical protein JRI68_31095, partial [Deltaproteobacteria bacterium]|nr:hypothetical protein [Deltaproteobacteria bacterium]